MKNNKRFIFSFALISLCYIALGLLLLLAPELASRIIGYILGGAASLLGLFLIAFYFIRGEKDRQLRNDLALGAVLVALGVYLFSLQQGALLLNTLSVFMGFAVLYDSVLKLIFSFDMRTNGPGIWWLFAILAIAAGAMGVLLIANPFQASVTLTFFAWVMMADGVLNLVVLATLLLFANPNKTLDKREHMDLSAAGLPLKEAAKEAGPDIETPAPEDEADH